MPTLYDVWAAGHRFVVFRGSVYRITAPSGGCQTVYLAGYQGPHRRRYGFAGDGHPWATPCDGPAPGPRGHRPCPDDLPFPSRRRRRRRCASP